MIDEFHGVHVHVQRLSTEGVRLQLGAKIVFRDTLKRMNLDLVRYAEFGERLMTITAAVIYKGRRIDQAGSPGTRKRTP